jgi:hypothetical protein
VLNQSCACIAVTAVLGLEALLAAYLPKSSLGQENKKACWAPSEWLVNAQEPGKGCGLGRTRGVGAAGLTFHGALRRCPSALLYGRTKQKADHRKMIGFLRNLVPRRGLEPPHPKAHGPEPCASTNSATWAISLYAYDCAKSLQRFCCVSSKEKGL